MKRKMRLLSPDAINRTNQLTLAELAGDARCLKTPKKCLVCCPHDKENAIFIVKTGTLRVYLSYDDHEFTLAFLEPGDMFSTHTRAFVEASQDSEVLRIKTSMFLAKMKAHPELSIAMLEILGNILGSSLDIIESLVFQDVRQRLIHVLIAAMHERGKPVESGICVMLGLNTEELGLLIGTSRQTISLLLNELIREGLIDKAGARSFLILDPAGLEEQGQS